MKPLARRVPAVLPGGAKLKLQLDKKVAEAEAQAKAREQLELPISKRMLRKLCDARCTARATGCARCSWRPSRCTVT